MKGRSEKALLIMALHVTVAGVVSLSNVASWQEEQHRGSAEYIRILQPTDRLVLFRGEFERARPVMLVYEAGLREGDHFESSVTKAMTPDGCWHDDNADGAGGMQFWPCHGVRKQHRRKRRDARCWSERDRCQPS